MWTKIWQGALGLGGTALKAVSPFMLYIKIGLIALLIGFVVAHLWGDHKRSVLLADVTEELGSLKQTNVQTLHTLAQNEAAMKECLDANAWNALQAKDQSLKTAAALANVRLLEAMNDRDAEEIYRDENTLRNRDQECRTADEPLPAWLLPDSLWNN